MNLYPQSFLRLILLGNVLTAVPLVAAIAYGSISLSDLSQRSTHAMQEAARTAALTRTLPEDLANMERSLRQYEVLRRPALLDDYRQFREDWRRGVTDFASIPLLQEVAPAIVKLRSIELATFDAIQNEANGTVQARGQLNLLKQALTPVIVAADQRVAQEAAAFSERAEVIRGRMLMAQAAAVLLTAAMLWLGRSVAARLWSRFERAVLALGEGRLERRIRIKGPSDMQRVGEKLEWLRQRIIVLQEQRTLMLRHGSHELKTPLAALREGTSLLGDGSVGPLSDGQQKIVKIMHSNVARLQHLIDGLLKLQEAHYAGGSLNAVPLRLDEVVQQVLKTHQLVTRDKQLHVSGTLVPLVVKGSHEALVTIIDNLVSNAIKFSYESTTIRIITSRTGDHAQLDVMDEGPGITGGDRTSIFQPFFRAKATKTLPGAGLGLAIAQEFALAHQGTLTLVEKPIGAHFRLSLPLMPEVS